MMRLAALFAILLIAVPAEARTATDSAGREIEVPKEINTVFAAAPPAAIFLYVLKPDATR